MKRPKSAWNINSKKSPNTTKKTPSLKLKRNMSTKEREREREKEEDSNKLKHNLSATEIIYSLFPRKIYAEIYYAWCKDCNEIPSVEGAKYFRDELIQRNNKLINSFNFGSMRAGKFFISSFCNNLPSIQIRKLELFDNLLTDECMHNIKNIISSKQVIHLNLASNHISTEGLKIIQQEVMDSMSLKYLNFGVYEGSYRVNNFSGDGGIILARMLLVNKSLETLILQENNLGEDAGDKIGAAFIKNKTLKKLVISSNKIKNKGARSIIENGNSLISIDLSNNELTPEVCLDLKNLIIRSKSLKEIIWNDNNVGIKGISCIVEALKQNTKLKSLSLRNSNLGQLGVQELANGLMNNEYLKILDLGCNNITFESFKDICDCLNKNKIKIFRCRNNLLGDESAKYFSETILNNETTTSNLQSFDFSSCKIYDQGLIYLLNSLTTNTKISWINLRDNYFSHEIDFVLLNFLEKNSYLTHIDLMKNRFSFQCLQKVNKIIKRNRSIQNNKEPNKLLVELYSWKYENTKLNELKETLKIIENDNAKLKLNKIDLRQDFELSKKEANEKINNTIKQIEDNQRLLELRKKELHDKKLLLEEKKIKNENDIKEMQLKYEKALKKKEDEIKLTDTIKNDTENLKTEMTKKIVELNDQIASNKVKEEEIKTQVKIAEGKLEEILEKIKIREEELKKMGIDVKKEEENKNSSKKNVTLNENQVIQEEKKDGGKTEENRKKGSKKKSKPKK